MSTNVTMTEHFGYHCHPFADTRQMTKPFTSKKDARICQQANSLLMVAKSFAITGPSGTGKSTLIDQLARQLDTSYYRPVLVHYGGLMRAGLLRALADAMGVDAAGRSIPLLTKLQKHICDVSTGKNPLHPVLIVDDAQLLERQSLLDLCSLITCPPKKNAAASLILVGDESLAKQLQLSVMTPVRTRLTAIFKLDPLTEDETRQFFALRLQQAKAPADLFEDHALEMIAAHCRGNRREMMNMATVLLCEAFERKEKNVSSHTIIDCELLQ